MSDETLQSPRRRAVQTGPESFEVLCDVCGQVALTFKKGLFIQEVGLVYTGITHRTMLPLEDMAPVLDLLAKEAFGQLHKHLRDHTSMTDGLDAYCPECDLIYCRDHLVRDVRFDEDMPSFYDCTYGTCPKGHRRMIDD